jgi:hypothetical protein
MRSREELRMTSGRTAAARGRRALPSRIAIVWRRLPGERKLAAAAALALLLTLFLPWYQESVIVSAGARPVTATFSVTGWGAFSFVEAAVMLVAISVLVLLFYRGEGRAFHLPGGDGLAIAIAGGWTCFLIAWRMLDKQGTTGHTQFASTSGIEWGIFVALAVAGLLTYSGTRIRSSHRPEPPLPAEEGAVFDGEWHTPAPAPRDRGKRPARASSATSGTDAAAAARSDAPTAPRTRPPSRRSSWRPADHPEWSEPESHADWTPGAADGATQAARQPTPHSEPGTAPMPSAEGLGSPDDEKDQLTIPLDEDR